MNMSLCCGTYLSTGKNLLLSYHVHTGSETHPASCEMVTGGLFPGLKRQGREADHSRKCSAEVQNLWSYTSTPSYIFMAWYLVKHRDKFTLTYEVLKISDWHPRTFLIIQRVRVNLAYGLMHV